MSYRQGYPVKSDTLKKGASLPLSLKNNCISTDFTGPKKGREFWTEPNKTLHLRGQPVLDPHEKPQLFFYRQQEPVKTCFCTGGRFVAEGDFSTK